MALDEEIKKTCKFVHIEEVECGKIAICSEFPGRRYLCTGIRVEQRGPEGHEVYVSYINIGAVAECEDNPTDNSILDYS